MSTSSTAPNVPAKPGLENIEQKWDTAWEQSGVYRFDRTATRDARLLDRHAAAHRVGQPARRPRVQLHAHRHDRPLPSACVARSVFYPMGWDDNGLPTERRVQNYFGVRCDPQVPYDPAFEPPTKPDADKPIAISRRNFIALCHRLTVEDEKAFEDLFRRLGLSVDWTMTYATIDDHCQRTSQLAFLRNLARGEAYQSEAPCLWDVTFRTAVAQAELEDKERPGAYHTLVFHRTDGGDGRWQRRHHHRHHPARVARGMRRVGRPSRRSALQAAVRQHGAYTGVRRRGAHPRPRARRSRKRAPALR